MLKQVISVIFISLVTLSSNALAETIAFKVTATIPAHVMMAANDFEQPLQKAPGTLAQVQEVVRNNHSILVRSIVVL
ncbi:MAG: hypothetical protein HQL17_03795 [Candidatus Omnitrophica bacterium]|nr:hypothetical protein [Candidatus Omnitrophota bacterium]